MKKNRRVRPRGFLAHRPPQPPPMTERERMLWAACFGAEIVRRQREDGWDGSETRLEKLAATAVNHATAYVEALRKTLDDPEQYTLEELRAVQGFVLR